MYFGSSPFTASCLERSRVCSSFGTEQEIGKHRSESQTILLAGHTIHTLSREEKPKHAFWDDLLAVFRRRKNFLSFGD
jgi:hypothetical protein